MINIFFERKKRLKYDAERIIVTAAELILNNTRSAIVKCDFIQLGKILKVEKKIKSGFTII